MFLSLLFLTYLSGDATEWLELDEIYAQKCLGAASNGSKTLLGISSKTSFQLVLFNFENRKARYIEDDRIRAMGTAMGFDKGFAILNHIGTPTVFFIHGDGSFLRSEKLEDYEGWELEKKVLKISPSVNGTAFVTLQSWQDDSIFLAMLDLKNKTCEVVFQTRSTEKYQWPYWVSSREELFFLNPQTGQIDLIDRTTFSKQRTLRAARNLVKRDASRYKSLSRRRPYISLVDEPLNVQGTIYYFWNKGAETEGDSKKHTEIKTLVQTHDGKFREEDVHTLAVYEKEKLVYHWMDQELLLIPVANK